MSPRTSVAIVMVCCFAVSTWSALAQHDFTNTKTVDPSGNADFTTISAAIADFGSPPSVRGTVFIYAGVYNENVVLGDQKENIDLVGVDPHSVIIAPSAGVGVKIESGTETARNNAIRNLTIVTTNNHGIEIVVGGGGGATTPKQIQVENVIIDANGTDKDGISAAAADEVTVRGCNISVDDGDGIPTGNDWSIEQTTIKAPATTRDGISIGDTKARIQLLDCDIVGDSHAVFTKGEDIFIRSSTLFTDGAGGAGQGTLVVFGGSARVRVQNCIIISDATLSGEDEERPNPRAVFFEGGGVSLDDIRFDSCQIVAKGKDDDEDTDGSSDVEALDHDITGTIYAINCDFLAVNERDGEDGGEGEPAEAIGVNGGDGPVILIGGTIRTSSANEREENVFDIRVPVDPVHIADVDFSKWKGAIQPASRAASTVQRTLNISTPSTTAILAATSLTGSEQEITGGITNPNVYRVLSVTGSEADMTQDVYIIGTNFAGEPITEIITLTGTTIANGMQPFMTVSKIILPAEIDAGETVSVGTTSLMGLQFPIGSTSAVIQQARKATSAGNYTVQSVGTVNATFATVDTGIVAGNDSVEWVVLASD